MNNKNLSVDEYIASFPEEVKEKLNTIRTLILSNVPNVNESISYGIIGYKTNNKPLVYLGGFKKHIGFYATPNGHEKFKRELSVFKQGKASVQFLLKNPLPINLILEIIKFRCSENNKMKTEKTQISAVINADQNKVWTFYTDPKHIIKWNFATPTWHCPKAENDLTIGGKYFTRMEAKNGSFGFDFEAIYTEITINKSFTYQFGDRFATVKLSSKEHQTEIKITFDAETENSIEMQKNGWQSILNTFKSYVETN